MTNDELQIVVSQITPDVVFDTSGEYLTLFIASENLFPLMQELRANNKLLFDYLFCMTCVDWKDYLTMVYFLKSTKWNHTVVVKAKIIDIAHPQIFSVNVIWKTAELNEDEIFDLFGVNFINHPNLRRIFLEDDWVGHPLRKNYIDEHMIEL